MRCTVHWLILRQSTILSSLRNRRSAPLPPLARAFSRIPLPLHARLAVLWHRFRAHGWRHSSLRREFFLVGPPSGADCLQALLLHPPRFTVLAPPPTFHSPSASASHFSIQLVRADLGLSELTCRRSACPSGLRIVRAYLSAFGLSERTSDCPSLLVGA